MRASNMGPTFTKFTSLRFLHYFVYMNTKIINKYFLRVPSTFRNSYLYVHKWKNHSKYRWVPHKQKTCNWMNWKLLISSRFSKDDRLFITLTWKYHWEIYVKYAIRIDWDNRCVRQHVFAYWLNFISFIEVIIYLVS